MVLGETVHGRYRVRAPLGSGGMGTVVLAEDLARHGAPVALKVVGLAGSGGPADPSAAEALIHEFETLARLHHPNLPAVHDFGRLEGGSGVFLTMEHVEGLPLTEAAAGMDAAAALEIVAQVCRALEFIHTRGLVHRDVKPENILVTRERDGSARAVLVDFGLAGAALEGGRLRGTLHYVAPEVLKGERADRRADLYALGVVLYRLATGRCPFEGTPEEVLRAHLEASPARPGARPPSGAAPLAAIAGEAIADVVLRLLAKDPAARYRSAAETLEAINRATGTEHPLETAATGGSYASGAPLEGRERAMAIFEAVFERLPKRLASGLGERDASLLLVAGEAGSGKSRLLLEAKRRAQVRGLLAASVGVGAGSPSFQPIAEAISLVGAEAVSLQLDDAAPSVSPEKARLRAADAAALSLARRAASWPVVLLLDDAHLADEGSLAVLESLVRNAAASPGLAVAVAFRPEEVEGAPIEASLARMRRAAAGRTEEIALAPLTREETARVLQGLLGLQDPPGDLAALVDRETSGNPFFIEQAVRALLEDGTVARIGTGFRADVDALTRIAFPSGAGEAIARRLSRLGAGERAALETLAVIARAADADLVARAAGLGAEELVAALASLGHRHLALEAAGDGGPVWTIAGARTRESVYEGIDWQRRRVLHASVARALEALRDAGAPVRFEEIARHHVHGSAPEVALPWALEAAERSRRVGASADAREFYRRALDLQPPGADAERASILCQVGALEKELGRDAQAIESLDQALRAAGAAGRRDLAARARLERAEAHLRRGRTDETLREIERALETLGPGGDSALVARAYSYMASALGRAGRMDRALEVQIRALAAAEEAGVPAAVAAALNNLGFIHFVSGSREEGIATMERAIRIRREAGDRTGEMETTSNLGMLLAGAGEYDRAAPCLETASGLARELGDLRALVESQINLGQSRAAAGQIDRAVPCFEEAAAVAIRIGDDVRASYALDCWGGALRTLGDFETALARHASALERARRSGDAGQEAYALASLALDHASASRLEEAREILRRASRPGPRPVPPRARIRLQEAAALTHLIAGSAREAADAAREILETARAEKLPNEEARARHLLGLAALAQGDREAAAREIDEAIDLAGRNRADEIRWRALASRAALAESRTDLRAARAALAEAASLIELLASRVADEEIRRRYLSLPERAKVREAAGGGPEAGTARLGRGALEALYRMSEILISPDDPDRLLERVLDLALDIVRAERGLIILVGEDGARQEVRAARGVEPETIADALEYSHGVVREAAQGRALITVDAGADQQFHRYRSVSLFRIKSLACVPMKLRDRVIGTVYLDSRSEGHLFHEDDLDFLRAFANIAAAALEMSRLNARLSNENVSLQREVQDLRKVAGRRTRYQEIIGKNARMQAIYDLLDRVSASTLPVLITGESGTGKELVARALHFGGPRRNRKFLSENVAAIPETLLESELFGHVRGAFTGADRDRKGVFELANSGTLFLDEIGDMPPALQSKVLRALQEGEIRPVGGKDSVRVDVRVISATNKNLEAMMAEGRFREDLYYRLNVIRIALPPLRDRKEDIPLLVDHFLQRAAQTSGVPLKRLDISALQLLLRYDWPGNIRELENEILKLVVLSPGETITQQDMAANRDLLDKLTRLDARGQDFQPLSEVEKKQIERALAEAGGNRARAAQLLGISRATIYRKLREYGLSA